MTADLIAVFGSSTTIPGSMEWEDAYLAGRLIGEAGFGVMTGGYGGTMSAASAGAASVGAPVVGVIAPQLFRSRQGANEYVTEVVEAVSLSERIGYLVERSRGIVAMPGSIGTIAELVVAWHKNHIATTQDWPRIPTVAVGLSWHALRNLLAADLGADPTEIHWEEDTRAAVDWVLGSIDNV